MNIQETAEANLRHVAKLTGAKLDEYYLRAEVKIGGRNFSIIAGNIYWKRANGHITETCLQYQNVNMPGPEMIAATLLLLRNDPSLFDQWYKKDGWHA